MARTKGAKDNGQRIRKNDDESAKLARKERKRKDELKSNQRKKAAFVKPLHGGGGSCATSTSDVERSLDPSNATTHEAPVQQSNGSAAAALFVQYETDENEQRQESS
jgi:hypothetical protein